jgi:hypothetical protein
MAIIVKNTIPTHVTGAEARQGQILIAGSTFTADEASHWIVTMRADTCITVTTGEIAIAVMPHIIKVALVKQGDLANG